MPPSADALVLRALEGADVVVDGGRPFDPRVRDNRFYGAVLLKGSLGLGESYVDGWWDCADLEEFFYRLLRWRGAGGRALRMEFVGRALAVRRALINLQTRRRARKVVGVHYDLPAALFEAMLGETMAYTCAYWSEAKTLDAAQEAKLDLICRKLELRPGQRVLDIGCGFGAFARHAADRYGCTVVGVNLSSVQADYARRLCAGRPVTAHVCDYRDVETYFDGEPFDAVVSIGMFEAVGHRNFRRYMLTVDRVLKDGGLWLLHTVGDETCSAEPWVTRYIFPNGELPTLGQIANAIVKLFRIEDLHNFGPDYVPTLRAWRSRFLERWPAIQTIDPARFTDRFLRTWTYYLASSAAAFHARHVQLWQIVLSKGWLPLYRSVR